MGDGLSGVFSTGNPDTSATTTDAATSSKDGLLATYNSVGSVVSVPAVPYGFGSGLTGPSWGSTDRFTDNDGAHSHSVAGLTTGSSGSTNHSHTVNPPATGSTSASTGQIMPYVQFLACRRD